MKVPTPLVGCEVTRTSFDYQVRLLLVALEPDEGYRVDAELVIGTPFLLADATGTWHKLDPGTGTPLAPAPGPVPPDHQNRRNPRQGRALHLTFDNGAELHIGPDPRYESWSLQGTGVDPILIGPGGERTGSSPPTSKPRPSTDVPQRSSSRRCHTSTATDPSRIK
jgi:hypothetical protein